MIAAVNGTRPEGILPHGLPDGLLVLLALAHGALLLAVPALPIIALGLWWNSNTIAHYFLHKPFFRARWLNTLFALYLSLLLGIPQSAWRDWHLAHHARAVPWIKLTGVLAAEMTLVVSLWGALLALAPGFFVAVYVPGYLLGLALCAIHGHYEHVGGRTISHHGHLYNLLFFNDGYHVEHHLNPGTHWTALPEHTPAGEATSRWPAILRWLDSFGLEALERLVLRSRCLQRFVLRRHEQALRALLPELSAVGQVAVVGGGLFPRTALLLQRLLPGARLVLIDFRQENIAIARTFLPFEAEFVHDRFDPARHQGFDLIVIPLAYVGERTALYRHPPAPAVLIHDWLWRTRGRSRVVSWLLLKRLNLVRP